MSSESKSQRNIFWQDGEVTREHREQRQGHGGATLWFTGLSASGKSTLARALEAELFARGASVYVLDGDNVRHGLNKDLGFSHEDRTENIRRIGEVAKLFTDYGAVVLTAFISPYRTDRDSVRSLFADGDFIEVYVDAPLAVCEERDPKGLYQKARRGEIPEFTGISAPYEEPAEPELTVPTHELTVDESVALLVRSLVERGVLPSDDSRFGDVPAREAPLDGVEAVA